MSEQGSSSIQIDAKFLGLIIFLATQLGLAVWWAGEKSAQVTSLQNDLNKLATRMDKQLDRMEAKLDRLHGDGGRN
jgi:hypothetical protein